MPARRPIEIRFWEKVDKRGDNECWNWTAAKDSLGYGWIGDGHARMARANRISYILNKGEIPVTNPRSIVCHTCDNPSCVNPSHLFLGTDIINSADRVSKGRTIVPRGTDCHSAVFTPDTVKTIRNRHLAGESIPVLAHDYNVSTNAIRKIVNRKSWKWVD